jgi:hypothetical protein
MTPTPTPTSRKLADGAQPLSQPRKVWHGLLRQGSSPGTAGGALRVQDLRIGVHPPGRKPAQFGAIDQVAALLVCRAQVGEQLPDGLIGQHRLQTINGFVGIATSPCKPERDKNIKHSYCDFNRHTGGLGGFVDPLRRGERGEQARLRASAHHCERPSRLRKIINLAADVLGAHAGPQNLDCMRESSAAHAGSACRPTRQHRPLRPDC